MNNINKLLVLCCLMSSHAAFAELQPISNEELDAEIGQAGVALSLEMRLNADAAGNSLCGTTALPMAECRLAIGVNNRGVAGVDQEWLVFKGIYGRIYIPRLTIDASTVSYTSDVDGSTQTIAALKLGYGGGGVNKIQINNLTISNIALERDNLGTALGTKGYMATSEEGFLGLQINGNVEIAGSLKMFPCSANHPRC